MNREQDTIMALKRSIIELESQGLSVMVVKHEDGEWIVKDFVYGAIDRFKKKIALDK